MASATESFESLLKKRFYDLNKAFDEANDKIGLLGARLGSSKAVVEKLFEEINKGSTLLMYLETRIDLNGSWDAATERLGQDGLDLLKETYKLFEAVNKKTDMESESGALLDSDTFEGIVSELAWYAKQSLKTACLLYLGKDPKSAATTSHKDIVAKLGG